MNIVEINGKKYIQVNSVTELNEWIEPCSHFEPYLTTEERFYDAKLRYSTVSEVQKIMDIRDIKANMRDNWSWYRNAQRNIKLCLSRLAVIEKDCNEEAYAHWMHSLQMSKSALNDQKYELRNKIALIRGIRAAFH